jgi:hypothetical protein
LASASLTAVRKGSFSPVSGERGSTRLFDNLVSFGVGGAYPPDARMEGGIDESSASG